MSATQPSGGTGRESYNCSFCGGVFPAHQAIRGSYCSIECFWEDKGGNILRKIEHDHRWCATCFRPVKEIDRPPADINDRLYNGDRVIIGQQFPTDLTVWATDDTDSEEWTQPIEYQRWGCECGNVNPTHRHEVLQQVDPNQTVRSLFTCLHELADENRLANLPTESVYMQAIREAGLRNWERVVGQAIYDS